ncbi:MAG TPA: type IV pilin protein [Gammaproteobacteria bacterium]|nr:type IV pilin protein [Gammaproteobacteria bacterium]
MNRIRVPEGARQQGFTLIELMIVVVVVAILAALAFPQYRDYVLRSNRAVAKSALTQIADRQEQFYVANKSYATTLTALGYVADPLFVDRGGQRSGTDGGAAIYQVTVARPDVASFTVTANVRNAQAQDTKCTSFTLNQAGQRTATGSGTDCW